MKKIHKYILPAFLAITSISCNEAEWLEEEPLSIYTAENSFSKPSDFNAAVARLYQETNALYNVNTEYGRAMFNATDIAFNPVSLDRDFNNFTTKVNSSAGRIRDIWNQMFQLIFDANVVISRIDGEDVIFNSEEQRNSLKAEAMFFRAYAYRNLGILYGGVPIVLEEVTAPKRDFVRASKTEVMNQIIEDLKFAEEYLPNVDEISEVGRLPKAAAQHLMAEVYIILENWDAAIAASSKVIDNPSFALMKERFGSRMNEKGDVYWDLFRRGNQNRTSGNTEGIWVRQYEYLASGGGPDNPWPRMLVPLYWQLKDNNGESVFPGSYNQLAGRGIGWIEPTDYLRNQVWESDFDNDMRNSENNIIRDVVVENPNSAFYGQMLVESGSISNFPNVNDRWWYPIYTKKTPINNFPDEYVVDEATGLLGGRPDHTFRDEYVWRLAETYLLRAEAHIGKGDKASAAADVNIVRDRANATAATPDQMDINYILDERARELCFEELRMMTLMRLGILVKRVQDFNFMSADYIEDHNNLWPIPYREIETNTEAILEQNPGYD